MFIKTTPNAYDVIGKYQQRAPVDVPGIARDLGINVWESLNLGPNISGKLFQDPHAGGSTGYSIVVNAADAYTRKRFTVAHEIAHFILHLPQVGSGVQDDTFYRSPLGDSQERQANSLAAEILMPENLIRQLLSEGVSSVTGMAKRLAVSPQAMTIRLGLPVV
jgi:hypothetical protein